MIEPIDIAVDLGAVPQPLPDLVWLKDLPPMDTNLSPQRRGGAENESSFDRIVGQRLGLNMANGICCVGSQLLICPARYQNRCTQLLNHSRNCGTCRRFFAVLLNLA